MVAVFVLLAVMVAAGTGPWEANDEPDHVQNARTLARGDMYRIGPGAGLEAHQPPAYYAGLAAWTRALGLPTAPPSIAAEAPTDPADGLIDHTAPQDGADQRAVTLLRLPSVLLGALTVALTMLAARRLSRDRWTPVVAGALVAAVPKFVFLSGVVNNDNLANALAAALTLLCVTNVVHPPASTRARHAVAAAGGLLVGLLFLAKITTSLLVPALVVALWFVAPSRREAVRLVAVAGVVAVAVSGWWLVMNQAWYGDPLASAATKDHLRGIVPALLVLADPLTQVTTTLRGVWRTFWYSSGWNQFQWPAWAYAPFWALLGLGLAGLGRRSRDASPVDPSRRRAVAVLAVIALASVAIVIVLGLQTTQLQGRVMFVGLPAIAVLAALGIERWPTPVAVRFALPALGLLGTLYALRTDVLTIY